MCDIRLFNRIKKEYLYAVKFFKEYAQDEVIVSRTVYDLQQTVEKLLKAYLECVGVTVPKTHNISKLVEMSYNNGSHVEITEWIDENSEMLTLWEASSRYNIDFYVELRKVEKAVVEVGKFIEVNGLKDTLDSNITKEVIEEIQTFLPDGIEPENETEWNVYYRLYILNSIKRK